MPCDVARLVAEVLYRCDPPVDRVEHGLVHLRPAGLHRCELLGQELVDGVDLALKRLPLLHVCSVGQFGLQLQQAIVGLHLQVEPLLHARGLQVAHADAGCIKLVLGLLVHQLALQLGTVLLDGGQALRTLQCRRVVD
ncbi:hypothetical protein D3C76_1349390 [compost metagenome]